MTILSFLKKTPEINFIGKKKIAFGLSVFLVIFSLAMVFIKGLNFGIDFTGGILIEAEFQNEPNLGELRKTLNSKNIGDVSLQHFGSKNNILIRVGQSSDLDGEQAAVVNIIKSAIAEKYSNIDYRKVDYVGPKVGSELIEKGIISMLLALAAIMVYIWLRFEWQFGVGAIVALFHDVILTLGLFAITGLEFNLSSIAAILTIIGYSINDSVVIFDRIRENLRQFKKMAIDNLLNLSINKNLNRTILTSLTTMFALLALVLLGGEVLKSFSIAALFGVVVGTYSSIYVASPILVYFGVDKISGER